ncbi:MAG: ComF family protein [Propionibacteriaceae bacterium]|nr:ComF family protein [Propionibacteriaceae bacterium]
MKFTDAAMDLLVQGSCPGCARPGRGVCGTCAATIMAGRIGPRTREGITVPLWSAGAYTQPLPRVISQAKDHHRWDSLELLGRRLAFAVAALADDLRLSGPGVLVPFPSQPKSVRQRGLDITRVLAVRAARHLRLVGLNLSVRPILAHIRAVQDQGNLTTADRATNLAGSLRVTQPLTGCWLIVVDDVVTTGASLREAQRALNTAGCPSAGLATIAATVLKNSHTR